MSENKKLELLDQYDDVTFALLMDEYAEEEGARLRKEFEEAQAAGEVTDTSDALDEKCLQMIHRDFAKKRGKDNIRKIIRMTSKVAVAVMVFFGVAATTIMSVDAWRLPVLNFIITHTDNSSVIHFEGNANTAHSTEEFPIEFLPKGYEEVHSEISNGLLTCMYSNSNGNLFLFDMTTMDGKFAYDSEEAIVEERVVLDCAALYIKKENVLQLVWFDEDTQIAFNCIADGLHEDEFNELCINIAEYFKGGE